MPIGEDAVVGVVGAGAMGAGIAQVAAMRGHGVILADQSRTAIERAREEHAKAMTHEVAKRRLTRGEADSALARVRYVAGVAAPQSPQLSTCALIIEAIIERLGAKQELFASLGRLVPEDTVLATNTSSLAVAAIAAACKLPGRVVGIHFFNPAPVMPLVEIVPSLSTEPAVVESARALVTAWGKTPVVAADTPGFIVNRIARPYYGESLRILEEGIADCATIDWAMRELGGFKMGPFELMDFIGIDVNYAVTCSIFEAMYYDPRYRPALTQRRLVESGRLGRKTQRGFFDYSEGTAPPPPRTDRALGERVRDRVLAMLINEAVDALYLRVASAADIELAMTKGVNYPRGLLAWGDEIGTPIVCARLEALQAEYGEDRYRPSPLLRRLASENRRILE